jgi:hypothetical protein
MPTASEVMQLAAHGWRVHPLRQRDKKPILDAWQKQATTDEDRIIEWWDSHPGANVGVAMGKESGIIDIECDSEAAEQLLQELFDGYVVPTCCFKSPRGMHRLFKYTESMPNIDKGHWKLGEIDFKIGGGGLGTYCLFPPSIHPSGAQYQWTVSPEECEPAELPEQVIARIATYLAEGGLHAPAGGAARPPQHWQHVMQGVGEGGRNDAAASVIGKLLHLCPNPLDPAEVASVYAAASAWNLSNKPPLPDKELKRTFDSILNKHLRSKRDHVQQVVTEQAREERTIAREETKRQGLSASIASMKPEDWQLVRVDANPSCYYRLYSPLWHGMFVRLEADDIVSTTAIRKKIINTAGRFASDNRLHNSLEFKKHWEGLRDVPGLSVLLFSKLEVETAHLEERRDMQIAAKLAGMLSEAKLADEPDQNGRPVLRDDGTIWFGAEAVCHAMGKIGLKEVLGSELLNVLKQLDMHKQKQKRFGLKCVRFKVITKKQLDRLLEFTSTEIAA